MTNCANTLAFVCLYWTGLGFLKGLWFYVPALCDI